MKDPKLRKHLSEMTKLQASDPEWHFQQALKGRPVQCVETKEIFLSIKNAIKYCSYCPSSLLKAIILGKSCGKRNGEKYHWIFINDVNISIDELRKIFFTYYK